MTAPYKVAPRNCQCHPETCACDPYCVVDAAGKKISGHYEQEAASKVAEVLNDVARTRNGAKIMERTLEDAAARVKELEDALRPFAKEAKEFMPSLPDDYMPCFAGDWRLGDLRRAAALLEKK